MQQIKQYRYSTAHGMRIEEFDKNRPGWYSSEDLAIINFYKIKTKRLGSKINGYRELITEAEKEIDNLTEEYLPILIKYPEELI